MVFVSTRLDFAFSLIFSVKHLRLVVILQQKKRLVYAKIFYPRYPQLMVFKIHLERFCIVIALTSTSGASVGAIATFATNQTWGSVLAIS